MSQHSQYKSFLSLLLLSAFLSGASAQDCVPCEGEVDPTLSFDGVPCNRWHKVAQNNSPAGSAQCAFDRMVGVWFCGCPVPDDVTETCDLCVDGSDEYNATKLFPDSDISCGAISTVPAIDGQATCRELWQMAGYCECPKLNDELAESLKCQLCPDGSSPATPERTFLTTGETCQQVIDTLDFSPPDNCGLYMVDAMVDKASFCGCPGVEAPGVCQLCPEGTNLADPTKPIQYVPGSTCADFEEYTKYISNSQLCDYMHDVISVECCEGLDPAQYSENYMAGGCHFCPDGQDVTLPDRELVGVDMTCEELASRDAKNDTTCATQFQTEFDVLIETQVYCGCPFVPNTGVCEFCPPGQGLINNDKNIQSGVVNANATCEQYAAMADSTKDDTFCSAIQSIGHLNECCGEVNETAAEPMCSLCGDGTAAVGFSDRLFLGTSVSCQTYADEMNALPVGDTCDAIFTDFTSTFDPQIYCGCPEAESSDFCNLCPEGTTVVDPDIWISDIFTTCGQMTHIAAATSDADFCGSIQRVGEYYCCYSPGGRYLSEEEKEETTADKFFAAAAKAAGSTRPYHFAAIKAMDDVQKRVAGMLQNRMDLALEKIEPDEEN